VKRFIDIVIASAGILLLFPLLLLIALVVWWSSSGPVLFRQIRVGRAGRDFILFKFRTMTHKPCAELGTFDAGSFHRVTRIGGWLRKTKLDELPQLWNVLIGNMSLVGPRPEVRVWVDAFPERWAEVLSIRPGITDPASVEFRNEEEILASQANPEQYYRSVILHRKLDLYEAYVRTQTIRGDLTILLRTFWAVIAR
jgi:lipopolysaccharide/colanic/teichoic acid biosynthesis glycosyltransferase